MSKETFIVLWRYSLLLETYRELEKKAKEKLNAGRQ